MGLAMTDKLKTIIRDKLDDYRYYHSLCVADEALRLAVKYGLDAEKAYIAGLLHDITKNFSSEEHLKLIDDFGIILSDIEKCSTKIWHSITGSEYVKRVLRFNDDEIISAIRYHTTAKADMSLFEKIIYLADFTSADRNYPDVDVMRNLVDIDPNKAMAYSLGYTIKDLVKKEAPIHPDTFLAYNQIVLSLKEENYPNEVK